MNSSLSLRFSAVVVLFIASLIGIATPLISGSYKTFKQFVPFLHTLSAGIMLGLALIHLMPEANEILEAYIPEYPLSSALVGAGIILNLALQQVAESCGERLLTIDSGSVDMPPSGNNLRYSNDHDHSHYHFHGRSDYEANLEKDTMSSPQASSEHQESCGLTGNCEHNLPAKPIATVLVSSPSRAAEDSSRDGNSCGHDHHDVALHNVIQSNSLKNLIMAYALEITTGIHSIIIGVDLGLLGNDQYSTITALLIALTFHQLIEGIGLGIVLEESRTQLGNAKIATFVGVFCCTVSFGVLLGIFTSSEEETMAGDVTKGSVTSVAAGSLLFTALGEMMNKYFSAAGKGGVGNVSLFKTALVTCFAAGVGFMALIGCWA